ncbi:MAG: ComF family protein [Desulfohalobiaceae bacterium]|nr:ComF family protein [Desulfohalobiaceae bacterium]
MSPGRDIAQRLWRGSGRILRGALRQAGTRCMVCGRALRGALPDACCPDCARGLRPRFGGYCPLCGEPYASQDEPVSLCGPCRLGGKPWGCFGMYAEYSGALRGAIVAFKYRADFGYLRLLRSCLLRGQELHGSGTGCGIVVPVPLHSRRLRQRGFNQSLELCRPLPSRLGAELRPRALSRLRDTASQSGLDRTQRRRNMRGSIRADPALVRSRKVLLVDDVYTTGITAKVCTSALLRAGASRVDLLVLARVPGS